MAETPRRAAPSRVRQLRHRHTEQEREQYTGKEEVMQTCVSLPRLTLHNYSHQCLILAYLFVLNLNIILQSINLIACDVQCKSVFDFGRSIEEGKIW